MKKMGVVANCRKARAPAVLARLCIKAGELGIELLAEEEIARHLGSCTSCDIHRLFDECDAVMALGGDGTMLRAARELSSRDKPIIGLNIGSLGFLTSVAEEDLERALECLARDDVVYSTRAIAEGSLVREGKTLQGYRALNDIVIRSGPSSRVITLGLSVNGAAVTSYVCDGMILSTPTGSTGHSLSAGGPILAPSTAAFVVSLICPHTLSSRPLVLPDDSVIEVSVDESDDRLVLAVDGQVWQPLRTGDRLRVQRSERSVRFIHLPGYDYFAVLRQKLRWSGSNV